jgi:transcriptional regulator with XRE-family HTH domain
LIFLAHDIAACDIFNINRSHHLSILKISIRQIKAARSLLDWSQERLAEASGVSLPTVRRLEAADGALGGRKDTTEKIVTALESAGVEFTNGGQPGVRMRKKAGS